MLSKLRSLYRCTQFHGLWQESDYFYNPKTPPVFVNGRCRLYNNPTRTTQRFVFLGTGLCFLTFGAYSFNKLYRFKERSWFGVFVYSSIFIFLMLQSVRLYSHYTRMIVQIDLLPSGREIMVFRHTLLMSEKEFKLDISKIARPTDINNSIYQLNVVFPILLNKELYFIDRDSSFIENKEILPAVMNAK